MIVNPYKIQPKQDWEIDAILSNEADFINDKLQLLLYLLKRYFSNFVHGAEQYHKTNDGFNIMDFYEDVNNLKFNRCYYPKVDNLLRKKLRSVLAEIELLYDVKNIDNTVIKNNDKFIAICPFLYDLSTWKALMLNLAKKHHSKSLKQFKTRSQLIINGTLNYLKTDKVWNLNEEYHFLLTEEEEEQVESEFKNIDIIKNVGFNYELEQNLDSYKYQQNNPHHRRYIFNSEVFFIELRSLEIKKRAIPPKTSFEIQLNTNELSYLYNELETKLNLFHSTSTRELWINILSMPFDETKNKKIILTPSNVSQVYYLFEHFLKKYSVFDTIDFYNCNKFSFENEKLNYNSAKTSFSKTIKKHNTFKGKQPMDLIFAAITEK